MFLKLIVISMRSAAVIIFKGTKPHFNYYYIMHCSCVHSICNIITICWPTRGFATFGRVQLTVMILANQFFFLSCRRVQTISSAVWSIFFFFPRRICTAKLITWQWHTDYNIIGTRARVTVAQLSVLPIHKHLTRPSFVGWKNGVFVFSATFIAISETAAGSSNKCTGRRHTI